MKIVQVDELPMKTKGDGSGHSAGRGGPGHSGVEIFDPTVLGRDGTRPDNFYFGMSYAGPGAFMTPRHHHNFDQMRYMLEGVWHDPAGFLEPGSLGVFPEGTYYGPQDNPEDSGTVLVMQFGGASGAGYLDKNIGRKAAAELKTLNVGIFEDGLYKRNPGVAGPPVQDAYEAIWEHVMQRPIVYPKPQYPTPIFIDSKAFPWTPLEGVDGVEEKALGTFTSCKYSVARYQVAPGATFKAKGRGVYFVLSGAGRLEDGPYRAKTSLYLEEDETATYVASELSDILYLGLPRLVTIQVSPAPAIAAE
ncbi:MAG TPA: hypothetical protein VG407_07260 [Caulobacteraceae bacterium]|jgi:hypothetical protein|nr:hypothetical protein [Caulobacteraceae bacterium]